MPPVSAPIRRGFTMIEILMVVAVAAIMMLIAVPRFTEINERSAIRGARQLLVSAFASARASAIQKGQVSTLTLTGSTATVTVLSGLAKQSTTVLGPLRFDKALKVTLSPVAGAPTTVTYDVRGMASPRLNAVTRYELRTGARRDTVCVSETGFVLQKDCKL